MTRLLKASAIALLGLLTFAPVASARRGGVVIIRPYYYRAYPYDGWYGPYGPWWGWGYGPSYYYAPQANTGEIKIESKLKGYGVYVDGGFAGRTGELKKFRLKPGNHTIDFRNVEGRSVYQENVYVIAGKTIKIHPDFAG